MIFKTFRQRLLFWFLIFISSNLIVIGLVFFYFQQRSKIENTAEKINTAHLHYLRYVKSQQDFLGFDTHHEDFFQTNLSRNLDLCRLYFDSTNYYIEDAIKLSKGQFGFAEDLRIFQQNAHDLDSIFNHLVGLVYIRGFKDLNIIGELRDDAHWLERAKEIRIVDLLNLRRHEKDYIIRNEEIYVQRFSYLLDEIANKIERDQSIDKNRKDTVIAMVHNYQRHFNELVDIDNLLGIVSNKGLKLKIDNKILGMESNINAIVQKTNTRKLELFYDINKLFGIILGVLFLISLIVSYLISAKITKPLQALALYIDKFIDSNFTLEENNPIVKSEDEIGILTKNFGIMKDEVVSSISLLNHKVAERTEELADANKQLVLVNEANKRFVPKKFLDLLGKEGIEQINLGDQVNKIMTVMFTDIRSFTQISESLSPQENFDFINSYLHEIVPIIQEHGGFIDKYVGDSIMALFPENPETAMESTLEFKSAIDRFNLKLKEKGMGPIKIGSGIHTGQLILGTVGTDKRLDTTVISDAVNIASRVEGLTKHYGVSTIFTDLTLLYLQDKSKFTFRFLDYVKVKGKSYPISIYELLHPEDAKKLNSHDQWEKAIGHYFLREFQTTVEILKEIIHQNPNDKPAHLYRDRCNSLIKKGVPDDWNGVQTISFK